MNRPPDIFSVDPLCRKHERDCPFQPEAELYPVMIPYWRCVRCDYYFCEESLRLDVSENLCNLCPEECR